MKKPIEVYCVTKKFFLEGVITKEITIVYFNVGFKCKKWDCSQHYEVLDCVKIGEAKNFFDFSERKNKGEYLIA